MNHFLSSEHGTRERTGLGCYANAAALGCPGTILYVEDEAFVREVTVEVLRDAGYQVLEARSAAEAADIFQEWGPEVELLLTDVVLQGETGRVLAAKLRRRNPQLSVLYVTGYAEQMGMRLGANEDCLAKPFSTDVLLERVRRMIDREESLSRGGSEAMLACAGA